MGLIVQRSKMLRSGEEEPLLLMNISLSILSLVFIKEVYSGRTPFLLDKSVYSYQISFTKFFHSSLSFLALIYVDL
jgi:hypothetical protein